MTSTNEWREDDPRETTESRRNIAICVDGRVFGGGVEVEYGWSVNLHHNHLDLRLIEAHEAWPKGWRWVPIPETTWRAEGAS